MLKGVSRYFSSKKIHVNENCHLAYPSALVLLNKQQQNTNSNNKDKVLIQIDANSSVKGVVLFEQESLKTSINFTPQIKISKNSIVTGDVYCNKNLELLGTVYGSVYTSSFITLQFGSTYTNHIYHGVINSDKLPKQFCGLSFKNPKLKSCKMGLLKRLHTYINKKVKASSLTEVLVATTLILLIFWNRYSNFKQYST